MKIYVSVILGGVRFGNQLKHKMLYIVYIQNLFRLQKYLKPKKVICARNGHTALDNIK